MTVELGKVTFGCLKARREQLWGDWAQAAAGSAGVVQQDRQLGAACVHQGCTCPCEGLEVLGQRRCGNIF